MTQFSTIQQLASLPLGGKLKSIGKLILILICIAQKLHSLPACRYESASSARWHTARACQLATLRRSGKQHACPACGRIREGKKNKRPWLLIRRFSQVSRLFLASDTARNFVEAKTQNNGNGDVKFLRPFGLIGHRPQEIYPLLLSMR
jgi:hypothetical protein